MSPPLGWLVSGQPYLPFAVGEQMSRVFGRWLTEMNCGNPSRLVLALPQGVSRGLAEELDMKAHLLPWPGDEESERADEIWGQAIRQAVRDHQLAGVVEFFPLHMALRSPRRPTPGGLVVNLSGLGVPSLDSPSAKAWHQRLAEIFEHADRLVVGSSHAAGVLRQLAKDAGFRDSFLFSVIPPACEAPLRGQAMQPGGWIVAASPHEWEVAAVGLDWVVQASQRGGDQGPETVTVWGGFEPDQLDSLQEYVKKTCKMLRVNLAGWPSSHVRRKQLGCSLGLVLPEAMGSCIWLSAEALTAGCPLVVRPGSEIREVAGDAALPGWNDSGEVDPSAWGRLTNPSAREELIHSAWNRAEKLSWKETRDSWQQLLAHESSRLRSEKSSPRRGSSPSSGYGLVWYSPLPPSVGGVSRYSQYFLKALQDKVPLMIRWTDQQPRGDWTETIPLDRADISASDTCIPSGWLPVYNVQNNVQQGSATYEAMLREPGLTILHDLNIHPFLLERHRQGYGKGTGWLGRMSHLVRRFHASRFRYFHELLAAHGPDGAMEARNVITADLAPDLPARHANRLVTRSSAAVIVHGAWSAEQLDRHGDTAAIYSMPLGIEYPLQAPQQVVMDLRERCGLTSGELVIVAAGILGHARRLDSALLAMAQADLRNVPCRLILSGTSEQGLVSHLQQLAARLGLSDRLVILGEVTDDEFAGVILLSDVVLHMHYPTSGQTSSTVLRAFSAGKPVLVSDTDAFRDLPDEVAWKVPTGQGEVPVLAEYLVGLSSQRQLLLDMGARARVYVEQHHTWDRVALRFLDIISEKESWHFPRRPPYQWPLP